jgi:hypothetical protein
MGYFAGLWDVKVVGGPALSSTTMGTDYTYQLHVGEVYVSTYIFSNFDSTLLCLETMEEIV